ncbi:MAG: sugar ABC transporter substrate-binding protein [Deltaproteobacteria bacterium]|nr:sugar ABC transporter substrate-binding protein [Deltaproteobacteria bacterium]RZO43273.1 MAG: extracellular solute-binding protein [Pseudomonadota bacterium]
MKIFSKITLTSILMFILGHTTYAACGITSGSINILANDFPALRTYTDTAKACAGSGADFKVNHTSEHNNLAMAALSANPAEYSARIGANSSIVPLMNEGLIRPMDDLVAKYGKDLQKSQLITIDGKVMAVAFMANTQHLYYREDILNELGIPVPKTYEEVLAAAGKMRSSGKLLNPYAAAYKAGWNLAEEFVNMYLGYGGEFFKSGSAEPNINNRKGVKTLRMLKKLAGYSNPDFLTHDSEAIKVEWEAGKVGIMTLWASRSGTLLDDEGDPAITAATKLAAPATVGGGSIPAATLWWDGFMLAKNRSDKDAKASFQALVHAATSKTMANDASDQAVWLVEGFKPGPKSLGVLAAAKMGANPYPMLPHMSLMHGALGSEIVDFLKGKESAQQALADTEAAYRGKAKEKGFL